LIIALDYDGTYTADPGLWDGFIRAARKSMHEVHLVTMRHESEPVRIGEAVDRVHYTDRKAKMAFMANKGINVQIWIDDQPRFILLSATPRALEQVSEGSLDWSDNA
jgi:hypothetical protein